MNVRDLRLAWVVAVAVVLSGSQTLRADEDATIDAAIEALIAVSQDTDVEVRLAALTVLASRPRSDVISNAFRNALQDEDTTVRQLAFASLVKLEGGTEEVLQMLVEGLNDPSTFKIARESLVELGERAVPHLLNAMKDDATKLQAIQLLGLTKVGARRAEVLAALTIALRDDEKVIRLEATRSLGKVMNAARRVSEIDPRYMKYFEQVFAKFDTNSDGALTEDEWTKMSKSPKSADGDGDGRITVIEYATWSLTR